MKLTHWLNSPTYFVGVCGCGCVCDSEDKLYLGTLIKSIGRSQNLGFRTLKVKQTNPHKPKRVLFPIISFWSLCSLSTPLIHRAPFLFPPLALSRRSFPKPQRGWEEPGMARTRW